MPVLVCLRAGRRQAEEDIVEIYVRGAGTFGAAQADSYFAGLEAMLAFLASNPLAARERTELSPPVRIHPYRAHLIVYRVEPNGILVLRLRHGREAWHTAPAGS